MVKMTELEPHLKLSVGFYLKNKPKTYRGLTQETWTFGEKPSSFSRLMSGVIYRALTFYINSIDISSDEINSEMDELSKIISTMKVKKQ